MLLFVLLLLPLILLVYFLHITLPIIFFIFSIRYSHIFDLIFICLMLFSTKNLAPFWASFVAAPGQEGIWAFVISLTITLLFYGFQHFLKDVFPPFSALYHLAMSILITISMWTTIGDWGEQTVYMSKEILHLKVFFISKLYWLNLTATLTFYIVFFILSMYFRMQHFDLMWEDILHAILFPFIIVGYPFYFIFKKFIQPNLANKKEDLPLHSQLSNPSDLVTETITPNEQSHHLNAEE